MEINTKTVVFLAEILFFIGLRGYKEFFGVSDEKIE